MKKNWMDICIALLFGVGLPWLLCALGSAMLQPEIPREELDITEPQVQQQRIPVLTDSGVQQLPMEDYLTGVLLGEIPASFAQEAKKAQAVVARTYALRVVSGDRHGGAVCIDSGCCQNYRDPAGVTQTDAVEQARSAVEQTRGLVLTYDGDLIDATYFSCSGGRTEAAVAVWGAEIPYLQSVESPGEEYAAHFTDTVTFTPDAFRQVLESELPKNPEEWFGAVTYTGSGSVDTMVIGGKVYTGTQLRKLLKLRSTVFTVEIKKDAVLVTTRGYGHRVGMSQYGADAMARAGSDFTQILTHYYQGVTLTSEEEYLTKH